MEGSLESLANTLATQQDEAVKRKSVLDEKLKAHNFDSCEQMLELAVTEDELSDTEKQISDYKQNVIANEKQLRSAREEAGDKELVDIDALKTLCKEHEIAVKAIREKQNAVKNRIDLNTEKRDNIAGQKEELAKEKNNYTVCSRLYSLVIGDVKGGARISLEQYIQSSGFDGILSAANRRLLPMSKNRFELFRKGVTGKEKDFLNIEALDRNTGKKKPVGNLSGGQSFMAALSLALGLSDTVSSHSGGVQMDALFVDEGFGTLDHETLNVVISTLNDLSEANKLVGIISHREELNFIGNKIIVSPAKVGSTFTVETKE